MRDRILAKLRMPDGTINPWVIAITVTLATFMEVLDTSIANVALPHIAGNLSAGQDESTWVLTSYLVSNAIVLPLSGWFSGLIGRKRFYMTCVAIFTLSSFLCGLAPSLGVLVIFRIMQGVGGGGLQPSEQAILNDTFPLEKRGMAFAVYGLAVVEIHCGFLRADADRDYRGNSVGVAGEGAGGRLEDVERPKLCNRDGGNVFLGIRVVFEHSADSAALAAIVGIHGATCGHGLVAGRCGNHVHDARRGNLGVKGGHADSDHLWVHRVGRGSVCDGGMGPWAGLRARGAGAHAAKFRAGVSVHSHKRVGVCVRAERKNQHGHGDYQLGAEHRSERRDCDSDDDAGPARAVSSVAADGTRQRFQRGISQLVERNAGETDRGGLDGGACQRAGTWNDLQHGAEAGGDAGVYR